MQQDKTIGKELSGIAPVLASLQKPKNEAVPAFYFAGLKEKVLAEIRKEETAAELKEISPVLAALAKPQLSDVPASYFANLPEKVLTAIQQREKQAVRNVQLTVWEQVSVWIENTFFAPQYAMAFAAVVSVVLLSGIYFSRSEETVNNQLLALAVQNLSKEDIQEYVLEYSDEFEEVQLENGVIETNMSAETIAREELRAYFEENTIEDWII